MKSPWSSRQLSRLRRAAVEAAVEVLSRPCLSSLSSSCRVSCRGQSHDEEPPRHSNGSERRRTAGSARTGYLLPKKEGDAEREPRIRFVRTGRGWECSDPRASGVNPRPPAARLITRAALAQRGTPLRSRPQGRSLSGAPPAAHALCVVPVGTVSGALCARGDLVHRAWPTCTHRTYAPSVTSHTSLVRTKQ